MESQLSLRIDWSELDIFGHVNNVMFMKYVQAARVNYVEQIGLMDIYRAHRTGFMVAETTCAFKKPLHFPGKVHLLTKPLSTGNTSFTLEHTIRDDQGQLAALAKDVLVVYDFSKQEKCAIPPAIRQLLI